MLRTTFIWSGSLMGVATPPRKTLSLPVRALMPPGPCYSRGLRCRCWCRWSCGPTRPPRRPPGPRQRTRCCRHFPPPRRSRWWWSQRRSWGCVCNDRSCPLWCLCRPSRRWFPGSSQSADCPSRVWRAANLKRSEKRTTMMNRYLLRNNLADFKYL